MSCLFLGGDTAFCAALCHPIDKPIPHPVTSSRWRKTGKCVLPNRRCPLICAQGTSLGPCTVVGQIGYQRRVKGGLKAFHRVRGGKEMPARLHLGNGVKG